MKQKILLEWKKQNALAWELTFYIQDEYGNETIKKEKQFLSES